MSIPRMNLIIPATGDPEVLNPLFESIIKNTVGSYSVTILKQKTAHPKAEETYKRWQKKCPQWKFLDGTDNMILTARNLGILENYIPVDSKEEQWFIEMDDDVILPPNWDEDMIEAAEKVPDGVIFVPLLTFRSGLYYKDQVAILPPEIWKAMSDGNIEKLNKFYSEHFRVQKPKLIPCFFPEYTFILRRNKSEFPMLFLLWDTAFDVVRNASRANEDLMIRMKKYEKSAYIIQSVMIFHRQLHRDTPHPKRHYAATALSNYLFQKWPKYKGELVKLWFQGSEEDKIKHAQRNMPKGLPPEAVAYFKECKKWY